MSIFAPKTSLLVPALFVTASLASGGLVVRHFVASAPPPARMIVETTSTFPSHEHWRRLHHFAPYQAYVQAHPEKAYDPAVRAHFRSLMMQSWQKAGHDPDQIAAQGTEGLTPRPLAE